MIGDFNVIFLYPLRRVRDANVHSFHSLFQASRTIQEKKSQL